MFVEEAPRQAEKRLDYSTGGYTTEDEIMFISRIGEWDREHPRDVEACLRGYLRSCDERVDWGEIDREEVEKFALEKLRHLQCS